MATEVYSQYNKGSLKGFNQLASVNVDMPLKENQALFRIAKYRAINNTLFINIYSEKNSRIVVRYNDAFKLKLRINSSADSGYETLLLNYYETNNGNGNYNNGNLEGKPLIYSVRQYVRLSYASKKILFVEKVIQNILSSNENGKSNTLEDYGILMNRDQFNDIIDHVDSNSTLESINISSTPLPNDID